MASITRESNKRRTIQFVGADKKRHYYGHLRFLAIRALQVTSNEQVEFLVRTSHLDVHGQPDRVIPLHQRIEEFQDGYGFLFL